MFQYHVEQEVTSALLRHAILDEQDRLLRAISIIAPPPTMPRTALPMVALRGFMKTHAKRWQATLFLLLDVLALNEAKISVKMLEMLRCIGSYLEWEGTIAHDLARYRRALLEGEENAFFVWKTHKERQGTTATPVLGDMLRDFEDETNEEAKALWLTLWNRRLEPEAQTFSLNSVSPVVEIIRRHYGQRHCRHKCDSF